MLKKSLFIIFLVLLVDQTLKFWIKTHMVLGQDIPIFGHWFIINFTENYGMAFGLKFGGDYGKLMLSLFRILAIGAIGYYLYTLIREKANFGFIACISLIFAGAMGNIIDSAFYGLLFSESTFMQTATFLPAGGGYGSFLHGKVVDMLYFPLFSGNYPAWVPFFGGQDFLFFRPVFNISDSAITTGVLAIIIFQKSLFKKTV